MFSKGDRVTVIDTDEEHRECCLGRTGTVHSTSPDGNLVSVSGIDNRITECIIGQRAYRPSQLRKG